MSGTMVASLPWPAWVPLDAASWEQTPLVVRQLILQLLAVIQQQEGRIAALEARLSQDSRTSDRPPSSDPPYAKQPARSGHQGRPGAKPGHPGHRQALLAPTEVVAVKPESCPCGQTEFPGTAPFYTHQVIELPEIQMAITHWTASTADANEASMPSSVGATFEPQYLCRQSRMMVLWMRKSSRAFASPQRRIRAVEPSISVTRMIRNA